VSFWFDFFLSFLISIFSIIIFAVQWVTLRRAHKERSLAQDDHSFLGIAMKRILLIPFLVSIIIAQSNYTHYVKPLTGTQRM
jgi:predicted MFS family arabinose efflux permease